MAHQNTLALITGIATPRPAAKASANRTAEMIKTIWVGALSFIMTPNFIVVVVLTCLAL